jgi:hypothetical protein
MSEQRKLLKRAYEALNNAHSLAIGFPEDFDENESAEVLYDLEVELAKPEPEPLCASCKAIGAACAIGKELPQQKPLSDTDSIREFESLLGEYWDCAYQEGHLNRPDGSKANEILHRLRNLFNAILTS